MAIIKECNVGGKERSTRIGLGAALLGAGIFTKMPKPVRVAAGVIGATGVVTGLVRYCPVSKAMHRNTCSAVGEGIDQ